MTKQINAALCSFGASGSVFHAPFLHVHEGYCLYAVWERSKKKAIEKYPSLKSFDTLEAMLADENIHLVIVNTPNYTHYEYAKKALLAKKHVLVEKSFTVTVSEAADLIRIAALIGKQLAVYQNRRYDSDFKSVKKVIEEGTLGTIVEVSFHFERFHPALSLKAHKETDMPGSGLLYDLGPHLIDQALYLFGMPGHVSGFLAFNRPGTLVNDFFDITMFYDRFIVKLKGSLLAKEPEAAYRIHGLKGSFLKPRADVQEDELKKGNMPSAPDWGTELPSFAGILNLDVDGKTIRTYVPSLQGNYMEFYNELYTAIVDNGNLPVSANDGLNVMRVIEAVQLSHDTLRTVTLNKYLMD